MKKLACLMLVALVCTVASAATMTYSGPATIDLNSTATISLIADADLTATMAISITTSKGRAIVGTLNPLINVLPNNGTPQDGTYAKIWISKISGGVTLGSPVAAGQALYTFTIDSTGLVAGDVMTVGNYVGGGAPWGGSSMTLKFNAADAVMTPFTVTVVPEPMTLALLGLGGLFIRSRK